MKRMVFFFCLWCTYLVAVAADNCDPVANDDHIGPWDYRDPVNHRASGEYAEGRVRLVEKFHFTPQVESLQKGLSGSVAGDISYTLKRIPNHPRALLAISRYTRNGGDLGRDELGHQRNVECYFDRAIRFVGDDPAVHAIYAIHLHLTNKMDLAEKQYLMAESLAPDNIEIKYNIGLFYFDKKSYELAVKYAKAAYDGHYPLQGLKEKLKSANLWQNEQ